MREGEEEGEEDGEGAGQLQLHCRLVLPFREEKEIRHKLRTEKETEIVSFHAIAKVNRSWGE